MMKKVNYVFLAVFVLMLVLILPAGAEGQPHPDPYSGKLENYEGEWIINGKTPEDTTWTLKIEGDRYSLSNSYQTHEGDITFIPGDKSMDMPDTIALDFDPSLGIDICLENVAGGLFDITGQGLIFVRPGNRANFEEAEILENYSRKDMVGDFVLENVVVEVGPVPGFGNMEFTFTNEDLMAGNYAGDTRLILSFDKGMLYQVSENLETRFPITRYSRYRVSKYADYIVFYHPDPKVEHFIKFYGYIFHREPIAKEPDSPYETDAMWLFATPLPKSSDMGITHFVMNFNKFTAPPEAKKGD